MSKATNMITHFPTDHGKLPRGGRVLVIGALNGCGFAGMQLAQYMGASEVIGVNIGQDFGLVLREGDLDRANHTTTNFADLCGASAADKEKFDVVYDCASGSGSGEDYRESAVTCLRAANTEEGRKHGQYVTLNGRATMWLRWLTIGQRKNQHMFLTQFNTKDLNLIAQLVDDGWENRTQRLNPMVGKVLPLTSQDEVVHRL